MADPLPEWQVWGVRMGRGPRPVRDNFLAPGKREGSTQIDFILWVAVSGGDIVVVDTGFNPQAGSRRGRVLDVSPADALGRLGLDPSAVPTVVLTHLHYDHAGNLDDFPQAQVVIQQSELEYTCGPAMRHRRLNHFFEPDDVTGVVRRLYAGGVDVIDGDQELRAGLHVVHIGGHTRGLQVVRVHTERGWVVLASDAIHYFENLTDRNPFPALVDLQDVLDGYERITTLAQSIDHIVPGHDPLIFDRYAPETGGVVALHRAPLEGIS